jgi:RHS repeat-associated protein
VLLCGNTLDELSLSHDGNQLRRVTDQCAGLAYEGAMDFRDGADAATEYSYDACGNMTSDLNKGITGISYNELNLPEEVRFADGHVTRYTWDAAGRKLRVEYLLNSTRFINPGLELAMPAARAALPGLAVDTVLPIPAEQTLLVRDYCAGHVYCGGRLDREAGLDLYDFAARQLDPALGRTTTQNPLAEKYYSISPYAWCASNPISNVDPSGMYYNSADSTQAAMYINMLEGREKALDELDVTDKNEQLAEIDKSLQDIEDMRNDPNRRYTFQEADAPETTVLKDGTILMKISPETGENFAHEIRHGGQVARGEYGYVKNEPDSRYGASHEISAYRAQLSSYGKISYMPDYGGDKMIELKIAVYGQMHVWKTITNLDEISVNFIMSICEGPGLNVKPIYKYGKEWFGR